MHRFRQLRKLVLLIGKCIVSSCINHTVDWQSSRFSFTGKNSSASAIELFLTCCCEMVDTIIDHNNVRLIHLSVMTDSVLLQGLGVKHSYLHRPHTGHGEQHHLITPEVPSQHKMQVLAVQQWRRPPSSLLDLWILLNLYAVMT